VYRIKYAIRWSMGVIWRFVALTARFGQDFRCCVACRRTRRADDCGLVATAYPRVPE